MANSIVDFPHLTKQEMMALSEIVFRYIVDDGELSSLVRVSTGAQSGDRKAWVGELDQIGQVGRGCEPQVDEAHAPLSEKFVDLKYWDFRLKECWTDLEPILYELGLKEGVDRGDLTGTEYADFLFKLIAPAVEKMFKRFVWFGDTAADTITNGGILKDDVNPKLYQVVDGFFKQADDLIASNDPDLVYTRIEANYQATAAAQLAYDWSAIQVVEDVILNATSELEEQPDAVIYVTKFFMTKLKKELLALSQYTESQFSRNEKGFPTVVYLGHTITQLNEWDEQIKKYFQGNAGGAYDRPFRIVYTTKSNIDACFPGDERFDQIKPWYDNKEKSFYVDGMDRLDVLVYLPSLISAGY